MLFSQRLPGGAGVVQAYRFVRSGHTLRCRSDCSNSSARSALACKKRQNRPAPADGFSETGKVQAGQRLDLAQFVIDLAGGFRHRRRPSSTLGAQRAAGFVAGAALAQTPIADAALKLHFGQAVGGVWRVISSLPPADTASSRGCGGKAPGRWRPSRVDLPAPVGPVMANRPLPANGGWRKSMQNSPLASSGFQAQRRIFIRRSRQVQPALGGSGWKQAVVLFRVRVLRQPALEHLQRAEGVRVSPGSALRLATASPFLAHAQNLHPAGHRPAPPPAPRPGRWVIIAAHASLPTTPAARLPAPPRQQLPAGWPGRR